MTMILAYDDGAGGGSQPNNPAVSSIEVEGITFNFSSPAVAAFDQQTGAAYVVGPATISSYSPARSGNRNGAMLNPAVDEGQGYDDRLNEWSSGVSDSVPIAMSAGDKLVAVTSSASYIDRSGNFDAIAHLHCVTEEPTSLQALGSTYTWTGDSTPEFYSVDIDTFYAGRTIKSSSNISWPTYASASNGVKAWPMFPAYSGVNAYQEIGPRNTGDNANYGVNVCERHGNFLLRATTNADSEADTKAALAKMARQGIDWVNAYLNANLADLAGTGPDGGQYQVHQEFCILALHLMGRAAEIPTFMGRAPGNWAQYFFVTQDQIDTAFASHDETGLNKSWWARRRTLGSQPGGSQITIPINPQSLGQGWDYTGGGLPTGTRFKRVSDGQLATLASGWGVPSSGSSATLNLTATNPFSSGDVIRAIPPADQPLQVGSPRWTIRGVNDRFHAFSLGTASYQQLQKVGAGILALRALGIWHSTLDPIMAYFELVDRIGNYPSSANAHPSVSSALALEYLAENWDPAWSVLTTPSAFALSQWSLNGAGDVSCSQLPNNGGRYINGIKYRLNGGGWQTATGIAEYHTIDGATVDFTIPGYAGENVEIIAVSAEGDGAVGPSRAA